MRKAVGRDQLHGLLSHLPCGLGHLNPLCLSFFSSKLGRMMPPKWGQCCHERRQVNTEHLAMVLSNSRGQRNGSCFLLFPWNGQKTFTSQFPLHQPSAYGVGRAETEQEATCFQQGCS